MEYVRIGSEKLQFAIELSRPVAIFHDECSSDVSTQSSEPVVFNRGAAESLGAVKSSRGSANLRTWRLFTDKL